MMGAAAATHVFAATHLFAATGRREALGLNGPRGAANAATAGRPRSAVAPPLPVVVCHAADRSRPGRHAQRCRRACDRRSASAACDDQRRFELLAGVSDD
jgi:hypothetical protein